MKNGTLMKSGYRNLRKFLTLTSPNYEMNTLPTKLGNGFTKQIAQSNY